MSEAGSNTTGGDFPDTKYYDTYAYSVSSIDYNRRLFGDATGEMGPFRENRGSWYEDYGRFVYSMYPWFERGGGCTLGTDAGVFYFSSTYGYANNGLSFRVVLAPTI